MARTMTLKMIWLVGNLYQKLHGCHLTVPFCIGVGTWSAFVLPLDGCWGSCFGGWAKLEYSAMMPNGQRLNFFFGLNFRVPLIQKWTKFPSFALVIFHQWAVSTSFCLAHFLVTLLSELLIFRTMKTSSIRKSDQLVSFLGNAPHEERIFFLTQALWVSWAFQMLLQVRLESKKNCCNNGWLLKRLPTKTRLSQAQNLWSASHLKLFHVFFDRWWQCDLQKVSVLS